MNQHEPSFAAWAVSLVFPPLPAMMVTASCECMRVLHLYIIKKLTTADFFLACLLNPKLLLTLKIDQIRAKSFALFWSRFGRMFADDFPSPQLDDIITEKCSGMVLDIGPGAGYQVKRFAGAFRNGQIKRIYGVEPGAEMHKELRSEAAKVFGPEVSSRYSILSTGAQPGELVPALAKAGLLEQQTEGVFDTIVSLRALCGIPEPQETIHLFYRLLKPGGRLIFFEHVSNSGDANKGGSIVAWSLQRLYMLMGWRFWNGGCELTRDTERFMINAAANDGGWSVKEVYHRNPTGCIPEIFGYMEKQ
ncbi:hypothetical protein H2198_009706 [Neophaeococcomyces mojaviensis]|uniref:Uncharacterized protein n=1 Tax=Neophaeococcomyces mojaviensis TaxID=3383035 RepID=A0ACC2ZTR4_9EURO|nr:hypothetical protein H2198_009706 [Knufia sp. JES_112]